MKALVTGADGFVGTWLVRHLHAAGDEVVALGGPGGASSSRLDITDLQQTRELVQAASPDAIYHLAGISFGPQALARPDESVRVTVAGTTNLLMAAADVGRPHVLLASSAEVYARAPDDQPVSEAHPVGPSSFYGATKASQELLADTYCRASNIPLTVVRSFNQIGPGQRADFVAPAFAMQLARAAGSDGEKVIRVGNLDVTRDFIDVRDSVRAFRTLIAHRATGVFNVSTGVGVPIRRLLESLISISQVPASVVVDPDRVRPIDTPYLVGDPSSAMEATGWRPQHTLATSLADVWSDAVARTSRGMPA